MREAALWISGAAVAFFLTAGAFLLLANLGAGHSEKDLPPNPRPARSEPALDLDLDESQLASLQALPDQRLDLGVRNTRDESMSQVNLTLEVSSENTALSAPSYYRETVEDLAGGELVNVRFELDLSPPQAPAVGSPGASDTSEVPRKIVEIRATTPEGASALKTVILPL